MTLHLWLIVCMHRALHLYDKHLFETSFIVVTTPCSCLRTFLVKHHVMELCQWLVSSHAQDIVPMFNESTTYLRHPCCCNNIMPHIRPSMVVTTSWHSITPMASRNALIHKIRCPRANVEEGKVTLCFMPLWSWVARYTCHRVYICVLTCRPCVKAMPWCPFG